MEGVNGVSTYVVCVADVCVRVATDTRNGNIMPTHRKHGISDLEILEIGTSGSGGVRSGPSHHRNAPIP